MSGRKREKEDSGGFGRRAYEADTHMYMCMSFFFVEPWKMCRGK